MPATLTDVLEQLGTDLPQRAAQLRQPSLSAAACVAGEVVWADTVGDANPLAGEPRRPTPSTRYRIASITKPQVAVAVLALVEAGEVDLGSAMRRYLPEASAGRATVAQFLSHTSGLVAEIDGPWWERAGGCSWDELVAMELPVIAAPGLAHHYSNVGYAVLGRLLERVHDKPWHQVLAEVVWAPLGMSRTGTTSGDDHATGVAVHPLRRLVLPEPVNPYLAMGPAGELWSTPTDLVRLGSFLAGAGEGLGVLRLDTLALLRHPAALATAPGEPWTSGYGLGVMLENTGGSLRVFHTGSVPGFTAHLCLDPGAQVAVALCGNSTSWHGGAFEWLSALAGTAGTGGRERAAATAPASLPESVQALAGVWYRGPRQVLVKVHQDELLIHPTDMPERLSRVRLAADDRLVGTSEDLALGEELVVDPDQPDDPRWFSLARLHHARQPYDPDAAIPGGVDEGGWRPWR